MGWNSANQIFDPVAQALVDHHVPDDVVTTVCTALIRELQNNDWDTEDESLEQFADHPAIVAAFAAQGVTFDDEDDD